MDKVDIVLVKPGSQKALYGDLSAFGLTAIEPPLWGALIAAYVRNQGYSVELFDAEVENWDYEETAHKISEAKPTLAALVVSGTNPSASTMNMTGAGMILKHLKEVAPEVKTALAGLHPSALPERTLSEEAVDFVVEGEGFHTLLPLIRVLKDGANQFAIPGLWYRKNGGVLSNGQAPLFNPLDDLPMPAWDLLPMKKYRAHNWHCFENIDARQPYAVIYTSLGCPFKCSFCCIHALFGRSGIRYRSPERVIEEIDTLVKNYNVKNIKILDEMFALNESHVIRLCDLIIERGYDLNMWAYARVNTVSEKMLRKMKKAGINWVAYGFESGSKKVLKGVSKSYDLDRLDAVVKMTYDQGLYICANFIFGLPEDDFDSMQATLDLALKINAEWANLYSAMAYPGSHLYKEALQKGWPLPETWQDYSPYAYDTLPLPTNTLNGPEVLRFRDRAFHVYFRRPEYLDMITRKFGVKTTQNIQRMVSYKMERRYHSTGE
jgi:anaerobic magnesium-protoporphyrin IX monomethyl ester cyclase